MVLGAVDSKPCPVWQAGWVCNTLCSLASKPGTGGQLDVAVTLPSFLENTLSLSRGNAIIIVITVHTCTFSLGRGDRAIGFELCCTQ